MLGFEGGRDSGSQGARPLRMLTHDLVVPPSPSGSPLARRPSFFWDAMRCGGRSFWGYLLQVAILVESSRDHKVAIGWSFHDILIGMVGEMLYVCPMVD